MHISEGVLPTAVLAAGWALTSIGLWKGAKDLSQEETVSTGVCTAGFFVASLIHVPLGPTSVHLLLNGMVGIILGWTAVPAIFVALLLQALLFQFGGIAVLGCNTVVMAVPAVFSAYLFSFLIKKTKLAPWLLGAVLGGLSVALSSTVLATTLYMAGEAFKLTAKFAFLAHVPVMAVEAVITGGAVAFLMKVCPEMIIKGR